MPVYDTIPFSLTAALCSLWKAPLQESQTELHGPSCHLLETLK